MFYCSFKKDVKQAHINVEKYNLDNNCKSYLSHIKGNQPTVMYASMGTVITGLIFYISCRLLQDSIKMSTKHIAFTTLYVSILTFITSYKTSNCMIARTLCPSQDCAIIDNIVST